MIFTARSNLLPDESCRKCGGLLLNYTLCGKCRVPTSFICKICAYKTLPRTHDQFCFKSNSLQTKYDFLPYIMIHNTYGKKPK